MVREHIVREVRKALASNIFISHADAIDVSIYGTVIILNGTVDNYKEKEVAAKAAREVTGVSDVINNLTIHPPIIEQL